MNLPSKLIEAAVNEFSSLPGIGKRTALRLVLYLLRQEEGTVNSFGETLIKVKKDIKYCLECHNISDQPMCGICSDTTRDKSTICIVEDIQDVMAIENTCKYKGVYHILGGIISPMNGIGPDDLNISSLLAKLSGKNVAEIIFALNTTMEGDTTNFYLYKKISPFNIRVSTIARGVAIGDELEYVDDITLGRSIINRTPYENILVK